MATIYELGQVGKEWSFCNLKVKILLKCMHSKNTVYITESFYCSVN